MLNRLLLSFSVTVPLSIGALGCSDPPLEPPNVIFISLDTLRKDAVGMRLSGGTSLTPNLDRLRADSIEFSAAFTPIPFTLPSHMSMITGLDPAVHGVRSERTQLHPDLVTLAEVLRDAGYATIGLVTNDWMAGGFGFARGFDHYETWLNECPSQGSARAPCEAVRTPASAGAVNDRVFELLDEHAREGQPAFLFLHYYDAHSDSYEQDWNTLPYYASSPLHDGVGEDLRDDYFCQDDECATDFLVAANEGRLQIPPGDVRLLHDLYLAGVRDLDSELGGLFHQLKDRGLYDSSIIVLTSDHGEEFAEHGRFLHSQPYVESIAVPLLIKLSGSGGAGTTVTRFARHADLMPTILDYLQLEGPSLIQGRSLRGFVEAADARRGDVGPATEDLALSQDSARHSRYGLRTSRYTLIHDFATDRSELYDLEGDPYETTDVGDRAAERAHLLDLLIGSLEDERLLADPLASTPREPDGVLTEDERERLRSLGYAR